MRALLILFTLATFCMAGNITVICYDETHYKTKTTIRYGKFCPQDVVTILKTELSKQGYSVDSSDAGWFKFQYDSKNLVIVCGGIPMATSNIIMDDIQNIISTNKE